MDVLLTIGDFSRMTYLGIKALRHYHEIGLLQPADIDQASGYRLYRPSQVPAAQVIRRLRDLGMPLEGVRAVLEAPDVAFLRARPPRIASISTCWRRHSMRRWTGRWPRALASSGISTTAAPAGWP